MTTATAPLIPPTTATPPAPRADRPQTLWRQVLRSRRVVIGGGILAAIMLLCLFTLPWTLAEVSPDGSAVKQTGSGVPFYTLSSEKRVRQEPTFFTRTADGRITGLQHWWSWFGYDPLGRSILARSLFGGTISLSVGLAAATISVVLGVAVGLFAGYRGGWVDSALMRFVDIMYGLPYILLVILFKIAFEPQLVALFKRLHVTKAAELANGVVLFSAIGLVSWLTMARVVRGQVLSLRSLPYIEACRALGLREHRVFLRHILPNLIGPITVYATLTVPSAILQESFLSFLGVGVNPPLATWGSLASEGVEQLSPLKFYWWLLVFPCALLAVTLLSLNFLGDGLRDVFDPKKEAAKI
jgi:ABC-type dipeptide/oligopeptide/nickel transport system permease subunit